jgi:hypothetical protein
VRLAISASGSNTFDFLKDVRKPTRFAAAISLRRLTQFSEWQSFGVRWSPQ